MSTKWNVDVIRKIAGLPVVEGWSDDIDDGDEDPDVKIAMSDKRQAAFERKNKKSLADADKPVESKAKEKASPKADTPKEKAEEPSKEKADTPEAKRRGAKPNADSKSQRALAWIKNNPTEKRGAFLKWAKENLEMGAAYGSAFYARHRNRGDAEIKNECWVITHPAMPSFLLAENRELNQMQWVDLTSPLDPLVLKTEAEAQRIATYMSSWKSQHSTIEKIVLED